MEIRDIAFIALGASWPILLSLLVWCLDACQRLYRYSYRNMYVVQFARIWARLLFPKAYPHTDRYTPEHWNDIKTGLFKEYFVCRYFQYRLYLWNKKQFPHSKNPENTIIEKSDLTFGK